MKPMKIHAIGIVAAIASLAACAQKHDGPSYSDSDIADIVVTGAAPVAPVSSGQSAAFTIDVSNRGPHVASHVQIIDTVGMQSKLDSMTCTGTGQAVCPSPVGLAMVADALPVGGTLHFVVTVELSSHGTGTILNSMTARYFADPNPNDNVVNNDVLVR
jgi:uncharacterized repeat protein (TIGR01451 family)